MDEQADLDIILSETSKKGFVPSRPTYFWPCFEIKLKTTSQYYHTLFCQLRQILVYFFFPLVGLAEGLAEGILSSALSLAFFSL